MIETHISLPWRLRLALLFGGQLVVTWLRGATGPRLVNVDVQLGKPARAPQGDGETMT